MKRCKHNLPALLLSLSLALLSGRCGTGNPPHSLGADISFIPQFESRGMVFTDPAGNESDICHIMANNGFDNIRLRIFVNPEAPEDTPRKAFAAWNRPSPWPGVSFRPE